MRVPERITVGVDTGGTFTDLVYRVKGQWGVHKLLSSPSKPALAVLHGLETVAKGRVKTVVHGSTIATNTLLERKGARCALITNKGMEDILEIGRQNREKLYQLTWFPSPPLVPKDLRIGIQGRILHQGEIIEELNDAEIQKVAEKLKNLRVDSVAVSLLFSWLHPQHELRVGEILEEVGFPVSLSHSILPEFREYERTSATVINAYVMSIVRRYISHLKGKPGIRGTLRIMQSNGGSISAETAMEEPVRTILSGPAGGAVGGWELARAAGFDRVITFDMGGTSTDVSLMNGKLAVTTEAKVAGFPVKVPMLEIHTVGSGGGSIAYVDKGGSLRVGPQSAGADPGPLCYGKGGKEITVTDAHLFLGRLVPCYFLGGKMRLHSRAIEEPFKDMAARLGISRMELAEGVLSVANANMERAIRVISVERGHDPGEFVLVAFGGAGGLHAPFLAQALHIPKVLIPQNPGTLSALGMLMADIVKDYSLTTMTGATSEMEKEVREWLEPLMEKAQEDLDREGVSQEHRLMEPALDMRYKGQSFEITVPLTSHPLNAFHRAHKRLYGYSNEGKPVEIVNVRLRAKGITDKPRLQEIREGGNTPPEGAFISRTKAAFDAKEWETPVYRREKLLANNVIPGPALVVEYSATLVIPPFSHSQVDRFGNIMLEIKG